MRSGLEGFKEVDVAEDQVKLSDILSALGRFGEAPVEAEKGLATLEKNAGTRKAEIATALYSLALARRSNWHLPGAAEAAQRSLEIRRGLKDMNPARARAVDEPDGADPPCAQGVHRSRTALP
jgi:hypothetical protein